MLGQLGRFPLAADAASSNGGQGVRGGISVGQKLTLSASSRQPAAQWPSRPSNGGRLTLQAPPPSEVDTRNFHAAGGNKRALAADVQAFQALPESNGSLPAALYRLLDPVAAVDLPAPGAVRLGPSDNRELDKLVAALGRNKHTWRRALQLHDWLLATGHRPDDRLCTTLIRVCAQHGQAATALGLYDWMRAPPSAGGGGLPSTVFTYTAAMRAALTGNMIDRALKVWDDAVADTSCEIDGRLCTTLIEVCARKGDTDRALETYRTLASAPRDSKLAPSVHAYTAAMRAAAEGGRWEDALAIWDDMGKAGCKPTGHAYAAVISGCAVAGQWERAVAFFDEMLSWGIKPDVVSCTALITALGTDGQWERAEKVVEWMLRSDIKPNVRTYTALVSALGHAKQWERALEMLARMRGHELGAGVEPNAYTYSVLLKTMGDQGRWPLAEQLFETLEEEQLALMQREAEAKASLIGALPAPEVPEAEISAFPGMRRGVATPVAATSSTSAIAAAAAAVAAVAQQQGLGFGAPVHSLFDGGLMGQMLAMTLSPEALAAAQLELDEQGVVNSAVELVLSSEGSRSEAVPPAEDSAAPGTSFSYFSGMEQAAGNGFHHSTAEGSQSGASSPEAGSPAAPSTPDSQPSGSGLAWTSENAAVRGLQLHLSASDALAASAAAAAKLTPLPKGRGPVNEVVCGALMMAYERAGKWEEAVAVLSRARAIGVSPNTVMYNTALSALGKAGEAGAAEALFAEITAPDSVSYETLIAAYGMAGDAPRAEAVFERMQAAGFRPRDYAFCGLVAAHSLAGDWRAALRVWERMKEGGVRASVHVYNALIAACDREQQYEKALELSREMARQGIEGNPVTEQLLEGICKGGVRAIESQQAVAAALSAAVAAAGTVMIRAGLF